MKRGLVFFGVGLVLYAVALVATLPAGWVYHWAKERASGAVELSDVSGTLWQGRARSARVGDLQVEKLRWDVRAWALALGRVSTGLEFMYQGQPGRMISSRHLGGKWTMADVDLLLPARSLQGLLRLPGTELSGLVDVKLESLALDQGRIAAAQGAVTWDKAAVVKPVPVLLGGFGLTLDTVESEISGAMKDTGGAVQADGLLKLKPDGTYEFTATFVSRDPRQPVIMQGLQLFGQPGPDGRVKVNTKGALPPLFAGTT